jgi:hypothetical protein
LDEMPDDDESLCCNAASESAMSCRAGQALRGVVTGVAMLNREASPGFIRESVKSTWTWNSPASRM